MKISVVIASYRGSELLNKCLSSLKYQTVRPHEVIVAFDKPEWVYGAISVSSGTTGVSAARNVGCDKATGDILAFIDDDAVAPPMWIEKIIESFKDNPDCVGGPVTPHFIGDPIPEHYNWIIGCTWNVKRPICCNMAIKRDVFYKLGEFNEGLGRIRLNLSIGEETELILKLQQKGYIVKWDENVVTNHHVPESRTKLKYMCNRAYKEGIGKAIIGRGKEENRMLWYYVTHPDRYTIPVLLSVFTGYMRGKLL